MKSECQQSQIFYLIDVIGTSFRAFLFTMSSSGEAIQIKFPILPHIGFVDFFTTLFQSLQEHHIFF